MARQSLRRGFLAARNIIVPNNLAKLRSLDTRRWLSLRKFSRERIVAALTDPADTNWNDIVTEWESRGDTLQRLCRFLRADNIEPDDVLYYSRDQRQLRRMAQQLI
jgi:hypothetical protein